MKPDPTHTFMQGILSHNLFLAVLTIIIIGFIALLLYAMTTSGKTIPHGKPKWNPKMDRVTSLVIGILMGTGICNYFDLQLLSIAGGFAIVIISVETMERMRDHFDRKDSPVYPMGRHTN